MQFNTIGQHESYRSWPVTLAQSTCVFPTTTTFRVKTSTTHRQPQKTYTTPKTSTTHRQPQKKTIQPLKPLQHTDNLKKPIQPLKPLQPNCIRNYATSEPETMQLQAQIINLNTNNFRIESETMQLQNQKLCNFLCNVI